MTCFWDGLLSRLPLLDINTFISKDHTYLYFTSQKDFINLLKNRADDLLNAKVECNGTLLDQRTLLDLSQWVKNYKVENIHDGHDCSTCDPFLVLISHLTRANITHNYNGITITYRTVNSMRNLSFSSDQGHFW